MQHSQHEHKAYRLVLQDKAGNVISEQESTLEDFANLLNDKEILSASDDAELEYYLIKHPELRIRKEGKLYWHQNYSAGKGMPSTFLFIEE